MNRLLAPLALAAAVAAAPPAYALSAARLEQLRQAEVVVVTGSADHMEQVLRRAGVKFAVVDPADLPELPLHGQQVLMVNCTGEMSAAARERVRRFVTAGGFLYTTDHAVHYLIERIFPGTIRWNGESTTEEIFNVRVSPSVDRGLLRHIGNTAGHARWQLAGGGYPFVVVDPQRVDVLMSSAQVGARYHAPALGVRFRVGDGQVIHVTGHFFTQPGQRPEVAAAGQAFEQLSANVVEEKRDDRGRLDSLYNVTPRREAPLLRAAEPTAQPVAGLGGRSAGAPPPPAVARPSTRVRVLEHKGDYARVRDAEGNEGWVPADAL
jgi:hypothetical protein